MGATACLISCKVIALLPTTHTVFHTTAHNTHTARHITRPTTLITTRVTTLTTTRVTTNNTDRNTTYTTMDEYKVFLDPQCGALFLFVGFKCLNIFKDFFMTSILIKVSRY